MTVSNTLLTARKALRAESHPLPGNYERRVFADSKFSIFIGVAYPAELDEIVFVVEKKAARGRLDIVTKAFQLGLENQKEIGHVRICLKLTHRAFSDLFIELCDDVVSAFLSCQTEEQGVETLRTRVAHWQRFMASAGDQGLSLERQLGLYGELLFLYRLIEAGHGAAGAINAWQGPLSKNQDFIFGTTAVEVKSTGVNSATRVSISNELQLDDLGLEYLYLCHQSFDQRSNLPTTLPLLIKKLEVLVGEDLISALDDRLLSAGYHRTQESIYGGVGYTERRIVNYRVTEGFPRIVPKSLPPGVQEVQYSIELSSATHFVVNEQQLFATII